MNKRWILSAVIIAILFAGVGILYLISYLKLRRMRALTCPDCHLPFVITSLTAVRRWIDFDIEQGSAKGSGFYLHCDHCGADYRFDDDRLLLGRVEQKAKGD